MFIKAAPSKVQKQNTNLFIITQLHGQYFRICKKNDTGSMTHKGPIHTVCNIYLPLY